MRAFLFDARRSALRWLLIPAALIAAGAHVPVIGPHLDEAPYMGVLFIVLTAACTALAVTALVRDTAAVYALSLLTCGSAIAGYVATRLVAFPMLADDVGNWAEPLGLVSIGSEIVVVLAAVTALSRSGARRTALAAVIGVIALGVLAGCGSAATTTPAGASMSPNSAMTGAGSSASSAGPASTTPAPVATIHIDTFRYRLPAPVAPGAAISVMNMDGENHTVTADSGNAFDVKAIAGSSVTFTAPMAPGSYPFHCTYHSNMHGVLLVG